MLRFYVRSTFSICVLLAAISILIHAHSYDDRAIRQLFLADGCRAPCFLGIQPGITTASEAIALLHQSQWVQAETIAYTESNYGGGAVWSWNNKSSPLLGTRQSSFVTIRKNGVQIVDLLHIYTQVTSGDVYLTMGTSAYTATGDTGMHGEIYMAWFYPDQGISVWSDISCPTRNDHVWIKPITIQFRLTMSRSDRTHIPGAEC